MLMFPLKNLARKGLIKYNMTLASYGYILLHVDMALINNIRIPLTVVGKTYR